MIKEFKDFIAKGNVMDLAVGVIIGGAFQSIVKSLVDDVIMPVITLITGGVDFTNWFVALDGSKYETLAEAQAAGASTLNYGVFITAVINFLLMALVIFFIVKAFNKAEKKAQEKIKKIKKEEEAKAEAKEEAKKAENTLLLEEIRDLLKQNNKTVKIEKVKVENKTTKKSSK